jgi:hypothetical protein
MWYIHLGLLLLTYSLGRWTWTGCNRAIIKYSSYKASVLHPIQKIGQKKGKEPKENQSAQKKSSNPQQFHPYGLPHHSRSGGIEYSHSKLHRSHPREGSTSGLVARARRRAREESSRGALQLQRQQTEEEAEAEKENKELATRATEGEFD